MPHHGASGGNVEPDQQWRHQGGIEKLVKEVEVAMAELPNELE